MRLRRHTRLGIMHGKEREFAEDLKHHAPHRFVIFRIGMDECAKCRKPRAEHPTSRHPTRGNPRPVL